jgi:hypothetical protein
MNQTAQDEFDYFCLSLAPELRRIAQKRPKSAMEVKVKIQQLLLDVNSD